MSKKVVKCFAIVAFLCTASFAQAEDAQVEFTYDDVKSELIQADELTELLFELGALDPMEEELALSEEMANTEELMSSENVEMLRRNGRRPPRLGDRPGRRPPRVRPRPPHRRPPHVRPRPPHRRPPIYRPHPPRRYPPVVRPRPPHRRYPYSDYVCYAENGRGERFQATGVFPRRVQRRAYESLL